jgi:hypothetical protein
MPRGILGFIGEVLDDIFVLAETHAHMQILATHKFTQ